MGKKSDIHTIRALNLADNTVYRFTPEYRCGINPKYFFAPPYFTDTYAFDVSSIININETNVDDVVYVEWPLDKFCVMNTDTGTYYKSSTVWRASRIIELIDGIEENE